jgi:hypothetical protein
MNARKNKFIVPYSLAGKWSIGLIGFLIVFSILFRFLARLNIQFETGGHGFFSYPGLAISILCASVSGILSLIIGVFAIAMKKERSVFVFLSCFIGFIVLIMTIVYLNHYSGSPNEI